ncbi:MAG: transposase [Nitrospira sp.]|nr:transposase [Nitrospira sp.]
MANKPRKRASFTEADRRRIVAEGILATPKDVCARYGISRRTFSRWLEKYGDRQPAKKAGRVADLERENRILKNKVAELWVDYNSLRMALVKTGSEC